MVVECPPTQISTACVRLKSEPISWRRDVYRDKMDFHTEDCVSQKWSIYHLLSSSYIKIFHLLSFKLNTGPEVFRHGHGMSLVSAKVHYSLWFRELHQWTRLLCACAQSRLFTIDGIKSVKRYKSKCRHTWGFWSKVQLEDYYDPRWGPCFKQHLGEIELCNNVACNSNIMSSCFLVYAGEKIYFEIFKIW